MNKKLNITTLALIFLLAACSKPEVVISQEEGLDQPHQVSIFASREDIMSKVAISDEGDPSWQAGDAIGVLSSNGSFYEFTLDSVNDEGIATFTGTIEGTPVQAVYPYSDSHTSSNGTITFNIPNSYNDISDIAENTHVPLYAKSLSKSGSNYACKFTQLGGVMKITLSSIPSNAKYIIVKTGKSITGSFAINDGIIEVDANSTGSTLEFPINSSTGSYTPSQVIYLPVPCGEIGKLTLQVCNSDKSPVYVIGSTEKLYSKQSKKSISVGRSDLVIIPEVGQSEFSGNCPSDIGNQEKEEAQYRVVNVDNQTVYIDGEKVVANCIMLHESRSSNVANGWAKYTIPAGSRYITFYVGSDIKVGGSLITSSSFTMTGVSGTMTYDDASCFSFASGSAVPSSNITVFCNSNHTTSSTVNCYKVTVTFDKELSETTALTFTCTDNCVYLVGLTAHRYA